MKKGLLITFEGTEGGGKSTQIQKACAYLESKGKKVLLLREPGGTRVSEAIRNIILDKNLTDMKPETELLLYLAARAQIVREKIEPALKAGKIVICDRYEDSTLAYQGYGRGFKSADILAVSRLFVRGTFTPDLTFLLDIHPRLGMKRGGRHDRMEKQSFVFHEKVYRGFKALAVKNKMRIKVIDATQSIDEVSDQIKGYLNQCLRIK